jgi:hypothetical protein
MHYLGWDLEKTQGSLFSGLNTRASPPFANMTIGVANTSTVQSFAWGMSDVILVVDTATKTLQAYI